MAEEIDFGRYYKVNGYRGVAFELVGYATDTREVLLDMFVDEDTGEFEYYYGWEEVEDRDRVIAIMVGDDYRHNVNVDDLTALDDLDYCAGCGQIGCTRDARDHEGIGLI
jgi:hypothetical protein